MKSRMVIILSLGILLGPSSLAASAGQTPSDALNPQSYPCSENAGLVAKGAVAPVASTASSTVKTVGNGT